jgi:hypothetical protein
MVNGLEKKTPLPVLAQDIQAGALLQIEKMKASMNKHAVDATATTTTAKEEGRISGARFCTLAMDATTGATEAFQLSDVAVQMVSEDLFVFLNDDVSSSSSSSKTKAKKKSKSLATRHVQTRYPVLVDSKETKELDSVWCLVNTALLSHSGLFAGQATLAVKRKNGSLTTKTKKSLLAALESSSTSQQNLLELLCDFNVLLALDEVLTQDESKQLCETVRKWARGQKRSTVLDKKLARKLKSILEHY